MTPSEILIVFGDWNVMTLRGSGWVVFPIWGADNLHALFFYFLEFKVLLRTHWPCIIYYIVEKEVCNMSLSTDRPYKKRALSALFSLCGKRQDNYLFNVLISWLPVYIPIG